MGYLLFRYNATDVDYLENLERTLNFETIVVVDESGKRKQRDNFEHKQAL